MSDKSTFVRKIEFHQPAGFKMLLASKGVLENVLKFIGSGFTMAAVLLVLPIVGSLALAQELVEYLENEQSKK